MPNWVFVVVVLGTVVAGYGVWAFNRLVRLRTQADNAWSDIDVQLKRRWDLVPRLVETVRGYAAHEKQTLEDTISARGQAERSPDVESRAQAEGTLTRCTGSLIALVEAYPDIKADEAFGSLQKQLIEIEDAVQAARRYHNAVVRDLNTMVAQFPTSVVATATRVRAKPFFELPDLSQAAAPEVDMGGTNR